MNANRTPTASDAVNQNWLDWVAGQMLTDTGPAADVRSSTRVACDRHP